MLRKKRTRQHVVADLGVNHVERQVLLCGHTVERVVHDYGYDLFLFTFDESGFTEPGAIGVQVKATEKAYRDDKLIALRVQRSDLVNWLSERRPVILVTYNLPEDKAYYVDLQDHFEKHKVNIFAVGQTMTVHIPKDRLFDESAVKLIVQRKNNFV